MRPGSFLILLTAFILASCSSSEKEEEKILHGFYFWKSTFDEQSDTLLTQSKADVVYHRLFDLEWDGFRVAPTNDLYAAYYPDLSKPRKFIPVIYISNEVFVKLNDSLSADLADKIYHRIRMYLYAQAYQKIQFERVNTNEYGYEDYSPEHQVDFDTSQRERLNIDELVNQSMKQFHELQIDCDWTPRTRQKYFRFLEACKKRFPKQDLSCTIRLYPYKYQKEMGIPPVDRGMLMCYNISDVYRRGSQNSIFDLNEVKKYLTGSIDYPLPLDYALPLFSWVAVYQQQRLVNLTQTSDIAWFLGSEGTKQVYADSAKGIREYEVQKTDYPYHVNGHPIQPGSILRVEEPNQIDVLELARLLKKMNRNPSARVVLYHFDAEEYPKNKAYVAKLFQTF